MRVMNTLTQNIIDNLTQLLKDPAGGSLHKENVVPLRVLPGQRGFAGAMRACKS